MEPATAVLAPTVRLMDPAAAPLVNTVRVPEFMLTGWLLVADWLPVAMVIGPPPLAPSLDPGGVIVNEPYVFVEVSPGLYVTSWSVTMVLNTSKLPFVKLTRTPTPDELDKTRAAVRAI